jgi:hypothetical protein
MSVPYAMTASKIDVSSASSPSEMILLKVKAVIISIMINMKAKSTC